jgi:hypothetical protein
MKTKSDVYNEIDAGRRRFSPRRRSPWQARTSARCAWRRCKPPRRRCRPLRTSLLDKLRELTTLSVEQRLISTLIRMSSNNTFTGDDGRIVLCASRYRLLCELGGSDARICPSCWGASREKGSSTEGTTLIIAPPIRLAERVEGAVPPAPISKSTASANTTNTRSMTLTYR